MRVGRRAAADALKRTRASLHPLLLEGPSGWLAERRAGRKGLRVRNLIQLAALLDEPLFTLVRFFERPAQCRVGVWLLLCERQLDC